MSRHTPLFDAHREAGAKLVDFAGWSLPLNYGSQLDEHRAVRRAAGVFDVSHMRNWSLRGVAACDCLRALLCNDVARLGDPGAAQYSCLLNERGGVIDDLIVYRFADDDFHLVTNAGTAATVGPWLAERAAGAGVDLAPLEDVAMLAVQGPRARALVESVLDAGAASAVAALERFVGLRHGDWLIGRTGYTGEDGLEVVLPAARVNALWADLLGAGVQPCGLGARDSLRLEAGMALYGNDLDAEHTPAESGIGWVVSRHDPEREFVGRAALDAQRADGAPTRMLGLRLAERGVMRAGQAVHGDGGVIGALTSAGHAPSLGSSIGFARVAAGTQPTAVERRGQVLAVEVVKPPFYRTTKRV